METRRIGILTVLLLTASLLCAADSSLVFTKTFGGSGIDSITTAAVDPSGNLIVAGATSSYDFPVTNGSANTATQFAVSPNAGAAWQPFTNLPAGTPTSLVVDTGNPPIWYATGTKDLYKSADGGATWQSIGPRGLRNCDTLPPFCGVLSLAINPAQPSTIYARTGSAGILKTTDGGVTWNSTNAPANVNPPAYLVLDPFHPDHLFTNIGQTDYRSFDGGQTWTQFTPPLLDPDNFCSSGTPQVAFDSATSNVVYMVDHCDLFRSTDGGIYWDPLTGPFQIAYAPVAHPTAGGVIYVTTFNGLYVTTDGGQTWTLLLSNQQGNPPHIVAVDPHQPSILSTDTARSTDAGATWTNSALVRAPSAIVFDPQTPGRVVAATAGASTAFLSKLDGAGNILASTYFGGQGTSSITSLAVDSAGNIYVTGNTTSPDFPAPPVPGASSFVAKFDSNLNLLYASMLGSNRAANAIAVDANGGAAVTGWTYNTPHPVCFVSKLSPDGSQFTFSKTLGGSINDQCFSVAADALGNTIVAGATSSIDFPIVGSPPGTSRQGSSDAFVAKFDPAGNLVLSGYLGGSDRDSAGGVAVDAAGNIYVTGNTASKDFPTTAGAFQTALSSNCSYPSSSVTTGFIGTILQFNTDDVFVTKLDPSGNLISSTYLGGGCYDVPYGLAIDPSGSIWILGNTDSDPFPQSMPFQSGPAYAAYKPFVTEFDAAAGSLKLSSYIDSGRAIALDANGAAYLAGSTSAQDGVHAWIAKVQPQPAGTIGIQSVGNAFSLRSGPVSPGQITAITSAGIVPAQPVDLGLSPTAQLPRTLANTQVLFDGEAAALISVTPGKVVAIAPYDLAGKAQTSVQVIFQDAVSAPVLADVHTDIAYRSLDGSGTGQAYAINPDGTLNSQQNPAPVGSMVTVQLTGVGAIDPNCPEGGIASSTTPIAGLASVPGAVCGLFQTTVRAATYPTTFQLGNSTLTVTVK
jgi:uncharacterized protein (TIGR03437 family)